MLGDAYSRLLLRSKLDLRHAWVPGALWWLPIATASVAPGTTPQLLFYIRLDGETSLGTNLDIWASKKGIVIERSAPYTPAQNGAAERSGKELIIKARAM